MAASKRGGMHEVNHEVTDDLDQNFDTLEYARSKFNDRPAARRVYHQLCSGFP
jgi:hypothetical protein